MSNHTHSLVYMIVIGMAIGLLWDLLLYGPFNEDGKTLHRVGTATGSSVIITWSHILLV